MKRVLLALVGTAAGMSAVLNFRTHAIAVGAVSLPSASLPGTSVAGAPPVAGAPVAGAPPIAGAPAGTTAPAGPEGTTAATPSTSAARPDPAGSASVARPGTSRSSAGAAAPPAAPPPAAPPAGAPAPAPAPAPSTSTAAAPVPRTFNGTAVTTQYGTVQVQATLTGTTITGVSFLQLTATDSRSQQINQNAGPILLRQALAAQSSHIDGVSGATYTSKAYEQSLQSAIDKAV